MIELGDAGTIGTDRVVGDGDTASVAPDTNPQADTYPTQNISTTVGTRVRNYKFLGYPDGAPAKGLQPMSLAAFFDPTGAKYRLIHIQASGRGARAAVRRRRRLHRSQRSSLNARSSG